MKTPLRQLASELLPLSAMKWLGLGAALWASGGCLLPQNEEYLNELPRPGNRPPRIVEKQVQPSERIIRGYGSDTCTLEFVAVVEDPDVADTLTAHWFVDYDPNQPRGADRLVTISPKGGTVIRDERAYLRLNFDSNDIPRLNTPGDHVVEVVVADKPLVGRDPVSETVSVDGVNYEDPGYTATYAWFVRTDDGRPCR